MELKLTVYRSTPNVCQHSLAAAEDMGVLDEYLVWVRKSKATGLNLLISKEQQDRKEALPVGRDQCSKSDILRELVSVHAMGVAMLFERNFRLYHPHHMIWL